MSLLFVHGWWRKLSESENTSGFMITPVHVGLSSSVCPRRQIGQVPCLRQHRAFTLIELMTVMLIIALLAAITMGVSGYVERRVAVSSARSFMSSMEVALENYKSDWGYYPITCPCRVSFTGFCEATNNWILYKSLSGANGRKKYMDFPAGLVRTNLSSISNLLVNAAYSTNKLINIYDPWSSPYVYFNSPKTPYSVLNNAYCGFTLGGQMNPSGYDLFSYGSDHYTYVRNAVPAGWYAGVLGSAWTNFSAANDDITNW